MQSAMGTMNAIYVRATESAKVNALRVEHPTAYTEPRSEFYAIEQQPSQFVAPEAKLAILSARLDTDVLWLGFQSVVDAFQFHRWRSGEHRRALVFGCFGHERTWERADGVPEEWERAAFFDAKELAHALNFANAQEALELQRIWRDSELVAARMDPNIDSRESARKVAEYYQLPGWS